MVLIPCYPQKQEHNAKEFVGSMAIMITDSPPKIAGLYLAGEASSLMLHREPHALYDSCEVLHTAWLEGPI